jgi:hypothetical protein
MRNAIVMLLLAMVSGSAAAEWSKFWVDNTGSQYFDSASIRRTGSIVKMWVLNDFNKAQAVSAKQFISQKVQWEIDCKDERMRIVFLSNHAENMGGGVTVYSDSDAFNWVPVSPESMRAILWRVACGRN